MSRCESAPAEYFIIALLRGNLTLLLHQSDKDGTGGRRYNDL